MTHADPVLSRKLTRLQVGIWVIFYIFLLLYTLQKWENPRYGFWAASIATVFYFIAVYVNSSWLIPKFYRKGKPWLYVMLSVLALVVLMTARMFAEFKVLLPLHLKFYSWHLSHFAFVFITNFLAFAFGALLRVSIDYLSLLKQQEELKTRQLSAELNLLKSQVQPHFLFNTLNNIYYLAYTKDERTPEVIAKLSDIMRYFVDEAPKERVPLSTEIEFLKNYIELEQIRMLHPVKLEFSVNADESLPIPPMLLIPLVENIFKHGVDKTIKTNEVKFSVEQNNGYLVFVSENRISNGEVHRHSGMGLKNLRKRLALLYGNRFELSNRSINDIFRASLKITI